MKYGAKKSGKLCRKNIKYGTKNIKYSEEKINIVQTNIKYAAGNKMNEKMFPPL